MNEKIRDAFDSIASKYDSNRKKLIPCFDELYSIKKSGRRLSGKAGSPKKKLPHGKKD